MNNVNLIGRLGQEPEFKELGGKNHASFSVAVYRNKENTDWFNCEAWEKTADHLEQWVKKGDQIGISGRLQQDKWEKDGEKRSAVKVVVSNITLISNNKKDGECSEEKQPVATGATKAKGKAKTDNDDEIPF